MAVYLKLSLDPPSSSLERSRRRRTTVKLPRETRCGNYPLKGTPCHPSLPSAHEPFDGPEQLVPEQYRHEVRRPQNHGPIPRRIVPQVRGHGEELHEPEGEQPAESQEYLFLNLSYALALAPYNQQGCP